MAWLFLYFSDFDRRIYTKLFTSKHLSESCRTHWHLSRKAPAFYIEIASPGQLRSTTVPNYSTPLGGEIMIINNLMGIRWVVPGVRVVAGARLNFVIQIAYGLGDRGLLNVWINGKLATFPGNG
jgi:hypothetical protein